MGATIKGKVFVVGDNVDTDQIIPAQYLNLVPTIPEEYAKLGSYALCGLPAAEYPVRYVAPGASKTDFPIIVAGRNFGCGSSREHAPVSLGAAGAEVVIADSFARIFFRNCVATGEVYPVEPAAPGIAAAFQTGDEAVVDLDALSISNLRTGARHGLKDLGDVKEVVDAGGLFNYARAKGMIRTAAA